MLDVQTVKSALPAHLKSAATQSLTDRINQISQDPEMAEQIGQNFISYASVLQQGRFKTDDYLNAVAYVSHKLLGCTNQEAYGRVFPQRVAALRARGADDKEISAYVSAYNKGKLVNLIYEQTLVPTWVLNAHIYQEAINTQAHLMRTATSEKVRTEAANSILTHLKKPESKAGIEVNIGIEESSGMTELKDMLTQMAERQQELIGQGAQTQEIAHQKLYGNTPSAVVVDEAEEIPDTVPSLAPPPKAEQAAPAEESKPEPAKRRPSLFDVDPGNPGGDE